MIRNMYTLLFGREVVIVDYVHNLVNNEFLTLQTLGEVRCGRHTCISFTTIIEREESAEPPFILPENFMHFECNGHWFSNKTHHNPKVVCTLWRHFHCLKRSIVYLCTSSRNKMAGFKSVQ